LQTNQSIVNSRPVTLNAAGGTFAPASATTLELDGAIGGTGALTVNGAGTLLITNTGNNYGGATTVLNGTLLTGVANVIPTTSAVLVDTHGTFDLDSNSQSVGSIANGPNSGGTISLGSAVLTTGNDNTSTSFSGVIQDGGVSAGTGGSLVKVGTGTLTLGGRTLIPAARRSTAAPFRSAWTGTLGTGGGITFGGGTLITTGAITSARTVTLNAGGGTFSPTTGTLELGRRDRGAPGR